MNRPAIERWRRCALLVLLLGIAGTVAELLLLGHTEDRFQWAPLVLLSLGFGVGVPLAVRPSAALVTTFRVLMVFYLPAAAAGIYLHLKSNVEFELEMRPTMEGLELARESLQGAMPALAPGTMAYLGLLGVIVCVGHPASARTRTD